MSRPPRALVLANRADDDAGFVGERLSEQGYRLEHALRETPGGWPDPRDYDLVLSLGSLWSAYWDEVAIPVAREQETLRLAASAQLPVLGLCFGSQVLAAALGGSVGRAPKLEVGWTAVDSDQPELVGDGPWFQWHGDSWAPPPGARVLARNDVCLQAFELGTVLGVQFHPEVTPAMVTRWTASDPGSLAGAGLEPQALVEQTEGLATAARQRASALVDAFLARTGAPALVERRP